MPVGDEIRAEGGRILGRVIVDEEFATNRMVIKPESQDVVGELLGVIHEGFAESKSMAKIEATHMQGGVPNIVTEHVIKGLEGIFGDIEDEEDEIKLTE
jgi:hypothetical protein